MPATPNALKTVTNLQAAPKPVTPPKAVMPVKPPTAGAKSNSPAAVVSFEKPKALEKPLYTQAGGLEKNSSSSASGFVAGSGDVIVDIKNSDSGYNNKIYWSSDNFKTRNYIGIDNNTGSFNIGKFAEGTKIEFGIDNGAGNFFKTGAASGNVDNLQHAKVTKTAEGTQIGFEDLYGGGDNDFNDAIINVRNVSNNPPETNIKTKPVDDTKEKKIEPQNARVEPKVELKNTKVDARIVPKAELKNTKVEAMIVPKVELKNTKVETKGVLKVELKVVPKIVPEIVAPKVTPKVEIKNTDLSTNRSGLGDGTNPGQGDGRINATNQGINNPSKVNNYIVKPQPVSQFKFAV